MLYYTNNHQDYYDTTMLASLLGIHKSKLKRELIKFDLKERDYIVYNNRHLILEDAVIRLIGQMIGYSLNENVGI